MTKERQTVAVNEFVLRQVEGSGKTYSKDLTFQEIAEYAENQLNYYPNSIQKGYREGVLKIKCENKMNSHFYSPMVKINEDTKLEAIVTKRRKEERPYIQIRAIKGELLPTGRVDLILYRNDVLAENNEQSTDADWELIAFQAVPEGIDSLPMGSVTMMRNQLEDIGGTAAHYSSEEWVESVNFWQQYAFLKP
ncbi:MAG: hypothetical protein CMF96_00160 [Candidatus Marinimicrobia bacterium]|nr:hypothetical protein [Candidatus Neomarinimicrobiota bacterium]|tara:strand:+ start:6549 stop:7127 length:579 start_codon:yes stop_codon:yes gene_type:complete